MQSAYDNAPLLDIGGQPERSDSSLPYIVIPQKKVIYVCFEAEGGRVRELTISHFVNII